ncbi:hypothetical protein BDY19DRAFT_991938 [Irpex rosettiformis]|uniref:Uncharacterized protein n=1 Tax=Irpex rosettiformis TaxID=378272 RepID=A0ACB8U815_9APHY|nr:hypothetical protein BDY19DRAFT_991938 [Irpex rosettiformis]
MPTATRSQATLAQFNFTSKSSSKSAHARNSGDRDKASVGVEDGSRAASMDGDGEQSHDSTKNPKRPSPPQNEINSDQPDERAAKRLKSAHPGEPPGHADAHTPRPSHDHDPAQDIFTPIQPHTGPPSASSPPSPSPSQTTVGSSLAVFPRAQSAPADSDVPHLDFKRIPPSPSKGKGKDTLRFTSVPPSESSQDSAIFHSSNLNYTSRGGNAQEGADVPMVGPIPTTPHPRSNFLALSAVSMSPLTPLPPTPLPQPLSSTRHPNPSQLYQDIFVQVKQSDGTIAHTHSLTHTHTAEPDASSSSSRTPRSKTPTPTLPISNVNDGLLPRHSTALVAVTAKKGIVGRMRPKTSGGPSSSPSNVTASKASKEVVVPPKTPTQRTRTVSTPEPSTSMARARSKTPGRVGGEVPKTPGRTSTEVPKTPGRTNTEVPKTPGRERIASGVAVLKTPGRTRPLSDAKTPVRGAAELPKTPGRGRSEIPKTPGRGDTSKIPLPKTPSFPGSRSQSQPRAHSPEWRRDEARDVDTLQASALSVSRPKTPGRGSSIPRPKFPRSPYAQPTKTEMFAEVESRVERVSQPEERADKVAPPVLASPSELSNPQLPHPINSELGGSAHTSDIQPGHRTTEVAKKPPSRKRSASVAPDGPGGVRMTRSASLRQQETKKQMDLKGKSNGLVPPASSSSNTAKTPIRGRSSTVSHSRPAPSSSTSNPNVLSSITKSRPPASTSTPRPSVNSTTVSSRTSSLFSNSTYSYNRPPNSTSSVPSSSGALSTLSMALEKLNMPPPSRPSTSLGFTENGKSNDDDSEAGGDDRMDVDRDVGKKMRTRTRDDSVVGKASSSASKAREGGTSGMEKMAPFRRANTVGPSVSRSVAGKGEEQKQSSLMLPPPVPGASSGSSSVKATATGETKNSITVRDGMVTGKARGGYVFGNPKAGGARGIFGVAALPSSMQSRMTATGGRGGRVMHKASKVSSLPVVEGSPVKGGGAVDNDGDVEMKENSARDDEGVVGQPSEEPNPFAPPVAGPSTPSTPKSMDVVVPIRDASDEKTTPIAKEDGAGKSTGGGWRSHARRASHAHQLLSQSLSSLPQTPPKKVPATEGKGKERATAMDATPTSPSFNTRSKDVTRSAPGGVGGGSGIGARVSARRAAAAATSPPSVQKTKERGKSSTPSGSGSKPKTLKILRHCNVFVDVRTDDGDDAGSLFVEMLTGLGARILGRVGQSCTHIVYKNGLMSTLTRYRLLNNPKPAVVGIGWVVECVEQRARVEETNFLIDIEHASIAGSNKRRRSMLPKHLLDSPERRPPGVEEGGGPGPGGEIASSPSSEGTAANHSLDSLPPLERARRRQSQLFGRP